MPVGDVAGGERRDRQPESEVADDGGQPDPAGQPACGRGRQEHRPDLEDRPRRLVHRAGSVTRPRCIPACGTHRTTLFPPAVPWSIVPAIVRRRAPGRPGRGKGGLPPSTIRRSTASGDRGPPAVIPATRASSAIRTAQPPRSRSHPGRLPEGGRPAPGGRSSDPPGRWCREASMTQPRTREEQIAQDVKDLHGLGYAQELYRTMGGFSNFAIASRSSRS